MGIEPTRPAWKAGILPLNYTRIFSATLIIIHNQRCIVKCFLQFILQNLYMRENYFLILDFGSYGSYT